VLETTGLGGTLGGGTGGLSDAKGAGSRIVERRRDGSSALKAGACGSGDCCSIGGAYSWVLS
jgi:hypothetical protein